MAPADKNYDAYPHDLPDEVDEDAFEDEDPGEYCGRWNNGRLTRYCRLAGTEQCDFECPYRDSR